MKPWITPGLLCSINQKTKLYKKFLRNMSKVNENRYKRYRNTLVHLMRDAKRLYIQQQLEESKNDGKQTWRVLNGLINKCKGRSSTYPKMFYDDRGHSFQKENIVEGFNSFFSSIGEELEKKDSNCEQISTRIHK